MVIIYVEKIVETARLDLKTLQKCKIGHVFFGDVQEEKMQISRPNNELL